MKLVSLENITKYNELLNKKIVKSVNSVKPDSNGNIQLGTEKSTFNKVVYDTGYFSISTAKTYNFDLAGSDLENVSKDNVNIRLVAKVITAAGGYNVGDIVQLTPTVDNSSGNTSGDKIDVCTYTRGNTLYMYSGNNPALSIYNGTGSLLKANVQIKAVLTAFVPDDGSILLIAEDQNNTSKLIGLPNGTLTWNSKTIAPITGKIEWFAFNTPPDGYLVCNGAQVSRTTYADLFAAIGTAFGSGDGSTTFDLPDLIDRFAQGSRTVGAYKGPGLPNINGLIGTSVPGKGNIRMAGDGAFTPDTDFEAYNILFENNSFKEEKEAFYTRYKFDASRSNSIYGNSTTVQPPTLTLLPCIKY